MVSMDFGWVKSWEVSYESYWREVSSRADIEIDGFSYVNFVSEHTFESS